MFTAVIPGQNVNERDGGSDELFWVTVGRLSIQLMKEIAKKIAFLHWPHHTAPLSVAHSNVFLFLKNNFFFQLSSSDCFFSLWEWGFTLFVFGYVPPWSTILIEQNIITHRKQDPHAITGQGNFRWVVFMVYFTLGGNQYATVLMTSGGMTYKGTIIHQYWRRFTTCSHPTSS